MEKKVSVVGIGKLGLCVCLKLEQEGFIVKGVEIDEIRVNHINNKTLISHEPEVCSLLADCKNLSVTTNLAEIKDFSDFILIYVSTPSLPSGEYNHAYVEDVLSRLNDLELENKHILIGCTTMPGFTRDAKKLLFNCKNTTLNYHPEFIAQGSIIQNLREPDFVLIGEEDEIVGDFVELMFPDKPCYRMEPTSAEITKISVNCFITTKIAFTNMIGDLAGKMGVSDRDQILKAIGADTRIGPKCMKYGYGFGGPCFPRDNRALGITLGKEGIYDYIPHSTDISNKKHTELQAKILLDSGLTEFYMNNVCYKERCQVPIIEESQKLEICKILQKNGVKVTIQDTPQTLEKVREKYGDSFTYLE